MLRKEDGSDHSPVGLFYTQRDTKGGDMELLKQPVCDWRNTVFYDLFFLNTINVQRHYGWERARSTVWRKYRQEKLRAKLLSQREWANQIRVFLVH